MRNLVSVADVTCRKKFQTAYFVISPSIKHGEELICSYEDCRKVGIKFKYCAFCKVPVAKRNFQKRHKHGGSEVDVGDEVDSLDDPDLPCENEALPSSNADHISSIVSFQNKTGNGEEDFTSSISSSNDAAEVADSDKLPKSEDKTPSPNNRLTDSQILALQIKEWRRLLLERPPSTRKEELSRWLLKVLSTSDRDQFVKSLLSNAFPAQDTIENPIPILPPLHSPSPQPRKQNKRPRDDKTNNAKKKHGDSRKSKSKSNKQSKSSKENAPKDVIPDDSTANDRANKDVNGNIGSNLNSCE